MHASAICSIVKATEEMRASKMPIVKQLLKEVFRKNPPSRIWAETWNVKGS